jgi:hypothetical protein
MPTSVARQADIVLPLGAHGRSSECAGPRRTSRARTCLLDRFGPTTHDELCPRRGCVEGRSLIVQAGSPRQLCVRSRRTWWFDPNHAHGRGSTPLRRWEKLERRNPSTVQPQCSGRSGLQAPLPRGAVGCIGGDRGLAPLRPATRPQELRLIERRQLDLRRDACTHRHRDRAAQQGRYPFRLAPGPLSRRDLFEFPAFREQRWWA